MNRMANDRFSGLKEFLNHFNEARLLSDTLVSRLDYEEEKLVNNYDYNSGE